MKHFKITVDDRARLEEILQRMQSSPKIMPMINLGRQQNGYYWDLAGTVWYKYGLPRDCDQVDVYRRGGIFTFVADSDLLIDQAIAGCNLSDLCPNSRS